MSREKNPQAATTRKRAPRTATPAPAAASPAPNFVDPEMRTGFAPGHELGDWLAAEAEVDAELMRGAADSASG